MEKITLKFMAFRVAITLSLPSFFLALATLCRVYRYTLIWAFLFYAIYVQPVRTHSETGMCLMGHMPHAPCVAMIFVANERVSAARFWPEVGGPNGAGKFARLMID